MIIGEKGNYKLLKYTKNFICLDYINSSVGVTLQVFENDKDAFEMFDNVIEETNGIEPIHFDSFVRKIEDFV